MARIVKANLARRHDARDQVQDAQPQPTAPAAISLAKIVPVGVPLIGTKQSPGILDKWERQCLKLRKLDEYSVGRMRTRLERIARELNWKTTADLDKDQAAEWLTQMVESGKSGKTAKNYALPLMSLGRFLKRPGQPNPFEDLPSPKYFRRKGAAPFSADELGRLIEVTRETEKNGRAAIFGPYRSTIYELLPLTGLRIGELRCQEREDVHLEQGILIVTKDKARRRDPIALTKRAVELLRTWMKVKPRGQRWNNTSHEALGTRLFPTIPSPKTLKRDMKRANVPGSNAGKKGEWHRFRKSAVTLRRAAGGSLRDVSKFARHRESTTTDDLYDLPDVSELRSTAELITKFPSDKPKRLTRSRKQSMISPVTNRKKTMSQNSTTTRDLNPGRVGMADRFVTDSRRSDSARPGSNSRGSKKSRGAAKTGSMEPWGIEPTVTGATAENAGLVAVFLASHQALLNLLQLPGLGSTDERSASTAG